MPPSLSRPIHLRLLGEFDVAVAQVNGRRAINYSKPRLLLAMLALAQGKPYARAELASMLWPGEPKDERANLRHALFVLRRVFEPVPAAWITTGSTLALNPEAITVDVLALAGAAGYESLTLEQRLEYDRGDFLEYLDLPESGPFTAWKTSWQARIERDIAECRGALLARLSEAGQHQQALAAAKKWVHARPQDEGAHRHVIRLLMAGGDREAAVLAYQHCAAIMRERFDSEPSPQTRELIAAAAPPAVEWETAPTSGRNHLQPLAVLAVAWALTEFEDQAEDALRRLQAARSQLLDLARSAQAEVLAGPDASLVIVFGYPRFNERPAHHAGELACAIRAVTLPAGVGLGMGLHADIAPAQTGTRADATAPFIQRAMRLAYLAGPGEILVSAAARGRLAGAFSTRVEKRHGDHCCVLEQAYETNVRRMFGRAREFDMLVELWARLPKAGAPTAVVVRGEAGIGKSLLASVMAEYVRHTGGEVRVLACQEGHDQTPLHAVRDFIVRQLAPQFEALAHARDTPGFPQQLVDAVCQQAGLDPSLRGSLHQVLFPQRARAAPADGPQRSALMHAFASILTKCGPAGRPLLLVWEDLHWADHSSVALIDLLLRQPHPAPTLLLMTAREEFDYAGPGHEVLLAPLSRDAMADLVAHRAKGKRLAPALRTRIVEDADGIPLFAEELVRQVMLGADVGVAPAVADMIAVRLADLEPATRELAQFAAVAGQVDAALIARAAREAGMPPGQVPQALFELHRRGLIEEGASLKFRHALVRDAIYHTLGPQQRRTQHERVARYLVELGLGAELTESACIARHYELAQHADAAQWWCLAAREALAQSGMHEAHTLTERALHALQYVPDVDARRKAELEVQLLRGSVFTALKGGGAAETSQAYARTVELRQDDEDPDTQFLLMWGAWQVALSTRPHNESLHEAQRLRRYAEQCRDNALLGRAQYACGFSQLLSGDMASAERWLRACIQTLGGQPDVSLRFARWGADSACAARALLGWTLTLQGREDEGLQSAKAGLAGAERLQHLASRVLCLSMLGEIHRQRGEDDAALRAAESVRAATNSTDFALWYGLSDGLAGWVRARRHEPGALEQIQCAIRASSAGMPVLQCALEMLLAGAHLEHGQPEQAQQAILRASDAMERYGSLFMRGDYLYMLGNVAARQGHSEQAREYWETAVNEGRRLGLMLAARKAQACLDSLRTGVE